MMQRKAFLISFYAMISLPFLCTAIYFDEHVLERAAARSQRRETIREQARKQQRDAIFGLAGSACVLMSFSCFALTYNNTPEEQRTNLMRFTAQPVVLTALATTSCLFAIFFASMYRDVRRVIKDLQ